MGEFGALLLDSVAGELGNASLCSRIVAPSPDLLPIVTAVSGLDLQPVITSVLGLGMDRPGLDCIACQSLVYGSELD